MSFEDSIRRMQAENQAARIAMQAKLDRLMSAFKSSREEWENVIDSICGPNREVLGQEGETEVVVGSAGDAGTSVSTAGDPKEQGSGI